MVVDFEHNLRHDEIDFSICSNSSNRRGFVSSFANVLTEGGDDRIVLNSNGVNKYQCSAAPVPRSLFRASCTCNIPTEQSYNAAEAAYKTLISGVISVADIMDGVRFRIKSLYHLPAGTEVFLCPSGSDAEYIPLLIAKTLNKGKKVVNIVTCESEVGSGTYHAAGGRYFSTVVPIPDTTIASPCCGEPVEDLSDGVETVAIPARTERGIVDSSDRIQTIVDRCAEERAVPIVHCVVGSKTGIYEPYPATRLGGMEAARDAFVVVDACQGRFDPQWLHEYLDNGAIVLTTGSKFYRGPPFAGAVLVPSSIMERLASTDVSMPRGLRRFLTRNEIPRSLPGWRSALPDTENVGLALRWVAALVEMEPTLALSGDVRDSAVRKWRQHCLREIGRYPLQLEALESQDANCAAVAATIVSVRLRRKPIEASGAGTFLDISDCKRVFEMMPQDLAARLGTDDAGPACYIGQPVQLTKDEAVIRLALGADSLRDYAMHPTQAEEVDTAVIRKLALIVERIDDV